MGFEPTNELPRYSISNDMPQRVTPRGYAISLSPDCSLTAVNIAGHRFSRQFNIHHITWICPINHILICEKGYRLLLIILERLNFFALMLI